MKTCDNCKHYRRRGSGIKGYFATCALTRCVTVGRAEACDDFSRLSRTVIKYSCGKRIN